MSTPDGAPRGIRRRELIRNAAAAGLAAWAAPAIIGSVASPAAAVTVPTGCHLFMVDLATMTFVPYTTASCPVPVAAPCISADTPNPADVALYGLSVSPTAVDLRGSMTTVTFTIATGFSCTIQVVSGDTLNGGGHDKCLNGTGPSTSLSLTPGMGDTQRWKILAPANIRVLISCS